MSRFAKLLTTVTLLAVLAGAIFFAAPRALASDGTFNVSVFHGINGNTLGLSRELPVEAYVYRSDVLLAIVPLEFRERFSADLPAGNYTIKVFSTELGTFLPSMQVGPVELPEGIDVRLSAQLGTAQTPLLVTRVK